MTFVQSGWLFAIVIAAHNLEEAVWLPDWSLTAGRWHHAVGNTEFRFAVIVLTLLAAIAAWLAKVQGRESFGAYLVAGYALAMLLNALLPHLLATVAMRRYMAGTATAVLLNLPVTIYVLTLGFREGYIEPHAFLIFGPTVVASIPPLFWMGHKLRARS
jgi:Protein of unknown function with HXXEE motif